MVQAKMVDGVDVLRFFMGTPKKVDCSFYLVYDNKSGLKTYSFNLVYDNKSGLKTYLHSFYLVYDDKSGLKTYLHSFYLV
jgi:hypothetical protein